MTENKLHIPQNTMQDILQESCKFKSKTIWNRVYLPAGNIKDKFKDNKMVLLCPRK